MAKQIRTDDSLARNFLKKTIQKEYKQIRERCSKKNAGEEYYSDFNTKLIKTFVGPYNYGTIQQDFENEETPYCRMDLLSLYIYNRYLGRVIEKLDAGNSIDKSIAFAIAKCKKAPCVLLNRNETIYIMSLAQMVTAEQYIKQFISKVYDVDINKITINRSYEVKQERQRIEEIREQKRADKKLTKETQKAFAKKHGIACRELKKLVKEGKSVNEVAAYFASALNDNEIPTKMNDDNAIAKYDEDDESFNSKDNEIMFDKDDYPLTKINGEYCYADGTPYTGPIHNEDYSIYDPRKDEMNEDERQ